MVPLVGNSVGGIYQVDMMVSLSINAPTPGLPDVVSATTLSPRDSYIKDYFQQEGGFESEKPIQIIEFEDFGSVSNLGSGGKRRLATDTRMAIRRVKL